MQLTDIEIATAGLFGRSGFYALYLPMSFSIITASLKTAKPVVLRSRYE